VADTNKTAEQAILAKLRSGWLPPGARSTSHIVMRERPDGTCIILDVGRSPSVVVHSGPSWAHVANAMGFTGDES
jgi:hypothetical protein